MQPFIHEDFLLETDVAKQLFHEHAKRQPIIDYHCHLNPAYIATNHRFRSLTELWLDGDHYKWRAMRTNGVAEEQITGAASDWDKFLAWARTVPRTLRNPLYHWTHLELAFPFGIRDRLLDESSARHVFDVCNEQLREPTFGARGLLEQYGVVAVCTTDDPTDSLEHHLAHARSGQSFVRLFPTFRPDAALALDNLDRYNDWLDQLEQASNVAIRNYRGLLDALEARHTFFHEAGCRLSDHGLETVYADDCTQAQAQAIFERARSKRPLTPADASMFRAALLHELSCMDHVRGWTQQFHVGALRNNSTRFYHSIGPDTGFDSIGDDNYGRPLARFLDRLDSKGQLTKTILYNLNPRDNELLATIIGCFQDGSIPGKLQFGSAWWFLDQLEGMERQMNALSNMGLLSCFVGMLTDSRSFVSYSRHDYFRRLLCNMLGHDVRRGLLPDDRKLLGALVSDVCFENARRYFRLPGL